MSFIKEFQTFISRGNVVDLAIGVIIGAAFGKIVSSLVADVLMPPLGLVLGKVNFTDLKLTIGASPTPGKPPVTLNYGNFLQTTFDFLVVAATIFFLVQAINRLQRKEAAQPDEPKPLSTEEKLLSEIRDLLRDSNRVATGTEGTDVRLEKSV